MLQPGVQVQELALIQHPTLVGEIITFHGISLLNIST